MGSTQGTAVRGDVRSRPRGRRHRLVVSHRGDPRERVDRRLLGEVPRAVLRRAASPDRGYPPTADRAGWAPAVLAIAAVVVSVAPQLAVDAIVQGGAVDATATGEAQLEVGLPTHFSPPVAMSAVAVLGGFSAYPLRGASRGGYPTRRRRADPRSAQRVVRLDRLDRGGDERSVRLDGP